MFRFPFSTLHEINLDWILAEVKKFANLIPPMEQAVSDYDQMTQDITYAVDTAEEAKDIAEQAAQGIIADGSVTTSKLADSAVTNIKIADGAISGGKIATNTITGDKLTNASINSSKIASDAVTTAKIADDSVTWDKLNSALQNKLNYKILYLPDIPCSAMTGAFASAVNVNINSRHIVANLEFADPTAIVGNVDWGTTGGACTLTGTCANATTVSILLIEAGNI